MWSTRPRLEHGGEPLGDLLRHARAGGDGLLDRGEDALRAARSPARSRPPRARGGRRRGPASCGGRVRPTPRREIASASFSVGAIARIIVQADARPAVGAVEPQRVAAVPLPVLDVGVVGGLRDGAGAHQAHAVATGRHRVARVPERDRILERLRRERDGREVVVDAAGARDLTGRERVADDAERVLEALPRLRPVAAEPGVLDRRDAAADAEVEAAARELVGDAHVLDDLHRMVQRQELHHRAEADRLRDLRRRGDEDLLARRQAEARAVVLGEVEAREPGLVGELHELEPILEQPVRGRSRDVLDVVEDAEGRSHAATLRG